MTVPMVFYFIVPFLDDFEDFNIPQISICDELTILCGGLWRRRREQAFARPPTYSFPGINFQKICHAGSRSMERITCLQICS